MFGKICKKCGRKFGGFFFGILVGRWASVTHPEWCKDCFWKQAERWEQDRQIAEKMANA